MYIFGNGEIDTITFIHKGRGIKFQCVQKPTPYTHIPDLQEIKDAEIEFGDSKEVDELIELLEAFKRECIEQIGRWEQQ